MASRKKIPKPQIHAFHDFISFLNELLDYHKKMNSEFSLRKLSIASGVAVASISMCLNRKRNLSDKTYLKLRPHLPLNIREKKYLDQLRLSSENKNSQVRIIALNEMQRIKAYQKSNQAEHEVHRYLKSWLHLAIREMVNENGFKPDPKYIQARLIRRVGLNEIRSSWEFLLSKGFVRFDDGKYKISEKPLKCEQSIYSLSLAEFHRQMLRMVMTSIDEVQRDQRYIVGHTVALTLQKFELATSYLKEAVAKIEKLSQENEKGEHVFHFEIGAIPLTQGRENDSK